MSCSSKSYTETAKCWAGMDQEDPVDLSTPVHFSDEEDDNKEQLMEVSDTEIPYGLVHAERVQ